MTTIDFGLTELIPLALVIALSPLSIIPAILMLHTPRPRPTSLAFLAGWTLGIAGITAAFVIASDLAAGLDRQSAAAPYVRIAIGADQCGHHNPVPAYLGHHVAEDREAGDDLDRGGEGGRCADEQGDGERSETAHDKPQAIR